MIERTPMVYVEDREPALPIMEDRHFRCYRCDAIITVEPPGVAKWPAGCPTAGQCWQALRREFGI